MSADAAGNTPRCWAVIPAAGSGTRMAADRPKQYLDLCGMSVLEHSLRRMAAHPAIHGIVLALSTTDTHWQDLKIRLDKPVWTVTGGAERCHSVLNALAHLQEQASADDWVLVHDAARPCVRQADIDLLIARAGQANGGLLAMPVKDTMKRADSEGHVQATVNREGLWHALTPQMFRLGELQSALSTAIAAGAVVTDEASAMERAGYRPVLVAGQADNIKITHADDLALATFYLQLQQRAGTV